MKKIKFYLSMLCAALMLSLVVSCGTNGNSSVSKIVEESQKSLPIEVAVGMTFSSITYDEDSHEMLYSYTYDENYYDFSDVDESALVEIVKAELSKKDEDSLVLLDALKKENAVIKVRFEGENGGSVLEAELPASEI